MNASTRYPHVFTPLDLGFVRLKNRILSRTSRNQTGE